MKNKKLIIGLIITSVVLFGGLVCLATGFIGYQLIGYFEGKNQPPVSAVIAPTVQDQPEGEVLPTVEDWITEPEENFSPTLHTLENEIIPINDPIDLAERLAGKSDIPRTKPVENLNREVGEKETFWVTNVDTAKNFQVDVLLAAKTKHLYFWIEEGLDYSQKDLKRLVDEFENKIYPTNRDFFGSEWSPGVDNDPRLYVIYASGLGKNLAGYFSSIDAYHPLVHEYSNAHETFMLNADTLHLGSNYTYNVLAHEFQHMIHWYLDRNETSWLNEGFSELATLLNGYVSHLGGFDYLFAQDPDLQLNDWPNDPNSTRPHYGASFLFVTYFLDRFGNEATKALVAHDLNGLASIDQVLEDLDFRQSEGGQILTADDVFMDWVITNYLKDRYNLFDQYTYSIYPNAPEFSPTEVIEQCPTSNHFREVNQYGADYIRLTCEGDYLVEFDGNNEVSVIPVDPYSGEFAFWSNKGDQSNMRLTREFDFTEVDGSLTLQYWTWYDLEEDYDYLYVEASRNGTDWIILETPSGTDQNPSGNSYGWGYNGLSGGDGSWIEEEVDLSQFAGEKIQIRFEYITDAAVHGEGFLLDDVSIPEIGYQADFEVDHDGWINEGFVRIQNSLPQTYRLAVIKMADVPQIEYFALYQENELIIPVSIGGIGNPQEVVIVVTGTTRHTRQKAEYQFQITQ